ncbi:hypothetical protein [Sphingomonas glacialis]|uniref:Uncharacterized protein n=1 Tax=Sphingomonas glacialis TaxID=658225 RepID=A0A502G3Y9_9SPHN|nr:hypothetical protein [Sphingomonas glacialis]TPG56281.1 hypothetical protein EAH76_01575 [Sphingomonas glacialis]
MRNRRIMVGIVAVLALIAVARHPNADIQILTHDSTDPAPHQVKAAIDLGVVGISLLVTWTGKHLT